MKHKIEKRYRVFSEKSEDLITDRINNFGISNKILSVNVSTCSHNLSGSGLRAADYILIYTATICFEYDVTEAKIQKEIENYITKKEKEMRTPGNLFVSPIEHREYSFDETIKKITETEDFKKFYNELLKKYENENEL